MHVYVFACLAYGMCFYIYVICACRCICECMYISVYSVYMPPRAYIACLCVYAGMNICAYVYTYV